MSLLRPLLVCVLSVLPSWSATFGTVVAHPQSLADLVLDEARKRIYLVDTYSNQVDVYSTASNPPALVTTIDTDATPLAVAMSRSGKSLYVACYNASTLDIFDLTSAAFSKTSVSLGANPEGVAVGYNELVLISTIGTGTGQAVLTTYNPSASGSSALQAIVVAPTAPATPQMPPPNGLMYFASKSQLQATLDGTKIIGVNQQASTRTVFVFDVASSTVLASRTIAATSPILAVSPDGSEFLSGPMLFETSTLLVLAQQNATNSPFVFPAGANFTTQANQGGAAFLPDGSELLTSYNIVPVQNPAAKPTPVNPYQHSR
jgi:DNA-binding beta-propeller fold protein YncE